MRSNRLIDRIGGPKRCPCPSLGFPHVYFKLILGTSTVIAIAFIALFSSHYVGSETSVREIPRLKNNLEGSKHRCTRKGFQACLHRDQRQRHKHMCARINQWHGKEWKGSRLRRISTLRGGGASSASNPMTNEREKREKSRPRHSLQTRETKSVTYAQVEMARKSWPGSSTPPVKFFVDHNLLDWKQFGWSQNLTVTPPRYSVVSKVSFENSVSGHISSMSQNLEDYDNKRFEELSDTQKTIASLVSVDGRASFVLAYVLLDCFDFTYFRQLFWRSKQEMRVEKFIRKTLVAHSGLLGWAVPIVGHHYPTSWFHRLSAIIELLPDPLQRLCFVAVTPLWIASRAALVALCLPFGILKLLIMLIDMATTSFTSLLIAGIFIGVERLVFGKLNESFDDEEEDFATSSVSSSSNSDASSEDQ